MVSTSPGKSIDTLAAKLTTAIEQDDEATVKLLLLTPDVNVKGAINHAYPETTPLIQACVKGNGNILKVGEKSNAGFLVQTCET